jgi:hypothetical protein
MLRIVNIIPRTLSAEARQDSEPNIAVNPENPNQIVATAFTRDPGNGQLAPVFVSRDGGSTWELRLIVPGGMSTLDITVGFGTRGGALYAGILTFTDAKLNILRTDNPFALTPMTVLVERGQEDQPWATAATTGADDVQDRVYIGHNDRNPAPHTASVFLSQDARTPAPPAGFATGAVERRDTAGVDAPPVRPAVHPDGTVYAAFQRWVDLLGGSSTTFFDFIADIVVVRDDAFAAGANPFSALVDPNDGTAGIRVATDRFIHFTTKTGPLGQERIGADMAIAVDPTTSDNVWIAWCDRVGGQAGTDWTIHVRRSTDRGQRWSADLRTVTNAKNPALAVNDRGLLGFMFQQLVGSGAAARWVTQLELTAAAFGNVDNAVLHTALASTPERRSLPYLGDYIRLVAVGEDFYGVFSGSNLPDMANFPNGITYQRNANFDTHTLLGTDNVTPVDVSIDPFFVHHSSDS